MAAPTMVQFGDGHRPENATHVQVAEFVIVRPFAFAELTARVRWTATMQRMSDVDNWVEVGDSAVAAYNPVLSEISARGLGTTTVTLREGSATLR